MPTLLQDFRYAIRQLMKSPGFAVLAIATLALGIGANTAMFTVVESVLLRPLPYAHSDRLLAIGPPGAQGPGSTSWLNYRDIRDQSRNLAQSAGYSEDVGVVQGKDGSMSVVTPGATPSVFPTLGVRPLLGRTFTEEEGQSGGPKAVLLSEGLWREAFNADPQIVGRKIRVNAQPRTVVGVMPAWFRFPESMGNDLRKGLWLPIQPNKEMLSERGYHFFHIVAQLKPGVTAAQEKSELASIARHIRELDPTKNRDLAFDAASYQQVLTGPVRPVFIGLVVALGLVLLIACANVANLSIARCIGRQQEFAVRAALGAGRMRLVRQVVVESSVLSLLGCAAGFFLAQIAISAIGKLPPDTIPRATDISLRWTVVLALAAIATITTILSSLLPALLVARTDPQPALQAASRGVGTRSARGRLTGWLVAGEVALSASLLIATGLLFHTLWNMEHARLGFEVSRVSTFTAVPADANGFGNASVSEQGANTSPSVAVVAYQPVLERMRHLPGIEDAALVTAPPLSGIDMGTSFDIVGTRHDPANNRQAQITAVSGDYAHVMRTPVIRGRMITDDDTTDAPFVVVINEALAKKYFAGQDPIGKQLDLGGKDTGMIKPYTIVGIMGDQVTASVAEGARPYLMVPYQQIPTTSLFYPILLKTVVNFTVKSRTDIAIAPAMRTVFKEVAPDFALDNFQTMQQAVDQSNFSDRLGLYLIAAFAGMAMLMVVAGLYGVLAQLVSYRRREIGVRLALGATRQSILTMVLRQGSVLVGAGIAAGVVLAIATGRLVKGFLYGVKPVDVWTYLGVIVLLLLVGMLASLIPARRAAAVEPIQALREQ